MPAAIIDALVVGGGPAGLGAALGLSRQNHSVTLVDSRSYRNTSVSHPDHRMHMVPTWDDRPPEAFHESARRELRRYERFSYLADTVTSIERLLVPADSGKHEGTVLFQAQTMSGKELLSRKLILATGVKDVFPVIPGYAECWMIRMYAILPPQTSRFPWFLFHSCHCADHLASCAPGRFHCLFCSGWEDRGAQSVGVLAVDECADLSIAVRIVRAAHQFSESVTVFTNGNTQLSRQLGNMPGMGAWCWLDNRSIRRLRLSRSDSPELVPNVEVELEDSQVQTEEFLIHKPRTRQASSLPMLLGLPLDDEGDIKVKGSLFETGQAGVFAVGDCASPHKFFGHSSVTGGFAAAGAAAQLQAGV